MPTPTAAKLDASTIVMETRNPRMADHKYTPAQKRVIDAFIRLMDDPSIEHVEYDGRLWVSFGDLWNVPHVPLHSIRKLVEVGWFRGVTVGDLIYGTSYLTYNAEEVIEVMGDEGADTTPTAALPASADAITTNIADDRWYTVKTEYADEPTCNREEYVRGLPTGYEYLAPILEQPEFYRLQFTVDVTRVTITCDDHQYAHDATVIVAELADQPLPY